MIIEYIKDLGSISCQVDKINENNIMHVIYSLSTNDIDIPQTEKKWNIYINRKETEDIIKSWLSNIDSKIVKLGTLFHPGIGNINFITIPTFENIQEMNEYNKKEYSKGIENIKKLDSIAEYDEEFGVFKFIIK